MATRKPIKHGLGLVLSFTRRDRSGELAPALYTRDGAQRYADTAARLSRMYGAVGIVSDCGDYWRVNVAAQPW